MFTNAYAVRNAILRKMGYPTYGEYLQSPLWAGIRKRVFSSQGTHCRLCKRQAEVVHHLRYTKDVMQGDNLRQLVPLCHGCHRQVEFDCDSKRSVEEAFDHYHRLLLGDGYEKWRSDRQRAKQVAREKKRLRLKKRIHHRCPKCGKLRKKNKTHCRACLRDMS